MKLYEKIAMTVQAVKNCQKNGNKEWEEKHRDTIYLINRDYLPSGSGFNSGTNIDLDKSTDSKLVLSTSYHHMNEDGFYNGWTDHVITVNPSLTCEIELRISGKDRNGIKEYIHTVFMDILTQNID